jgi:hypothetical protein
MKLYIYTAVVLIVLTVVACQKSIELGEDLSLQDPSHSVKLPTGKNILVDASKDGGVWWFPQSPITGFSETADHQGKDLANYLRSLGFHVDELPRGAVITDQLMEKYSRIIRVAAFFSYSDDEIEAYKKFLKRPGAILLLQDHLSYTTNDKLSELLGLTFRGAVDGTITNFTSHEITAGIGDFPFIAGAVVTNSDNNPNIVVLGSLDKNNYTILNNSDPFNGPNNTSPPVMGLVNNFPNTRIFFLGDGNGIEMVPQPLTQNLVNWLFN